MAVRPSSSLPLIILPCGSLLSRPRGQIMTAIVELMSNAIGHGEAQKLGQESLASLSAMYDRMDGKAPPPEKAAPPAPPKAPATGVALVKPNKVRGGLWRLIATRAAQQAAAGVVGAFVRLTLPSMRCSCCDWYCVT